MRIGRVATIAAVAASLLVASVAPPVVRAVRRSRVRAAIANAPALDERSMSLMAPDGSILAHYPNDFVASADRQGAFLSLHRPDKRERIIIISMPRTDLDDPRDLDRIMTDQVAAFAANGGGKMSTTISREGSCRGVPGITSTATITKPDASDDIPLKVVSCSMLANGRAYFFAYMLPEFQADAEEAAVKRIVDATEILAVPVRKSPPPIANRRPFGAASPH